MKTDKPLLEELQKIRQLLEFRAKDALTKELSTVATTPERRKMWALFDGATGNKKIAGQVGVTARAVRLFVSELQEKDLVSFEKRGCPKRKFDLVPSEWSIKEAVCSA
ncbi:MAG: hypothetical protein ACE5IO_05815 [Thermoplasmata archaeon]